ncbi:MAG: cupredoxin domain-containing protein, partial [Planctomycetota bacterium]
IHYAGADGVFGQTAPELIEGDTNPIGPDPDDPNGQDDVVEVNTLHIPKDKPILLRLTSNDVIHCFSVPLLRVKQDVVPGMEIPIWFTATQTSEQVRQWRARPVELPASPAEIERFVARNKFNGTTQDYLAEDGSVIVGQGSSLSADAIDSLRAAGITEVSMAANDPIDIQCAQLCGLGHYRMRGTVKIHEPQDFETWYASAAQEEEFFEDDED